MLKRTFLIKVIKENAHFLIGLAITISVLWPLMRQGYFSHHDDVQVVRLFEMDKCLDDFQFPCRWVPDMGGGYGYPIFNYYAPLPYYFGEFFYFVTTNLLVAAKLMFASSFVGAYVFMYLLGKSLWGKAGGAVSAIFYSLVPYHAVNLYVRGAMGEMWAMTFIPLIFYFLFRLSQKTNINSSIKLAIALALLITSHNLSFVMFTPTIFVFALIFYIKDHSVKFLKLFSLSILFSLVFSAFYWLPAVAEGKYVHLETMTVGYFSYTEHFKGLRKLFIDRNWAWGPSIREVPGGEKDQMPYQVGWIHLAGYLLSLVTLWMFANKPKRKVYRLIGIGSSIIIVASVFMIHPRSVYVWNFFGTILKYIQFPWRFLIVVSFFISLLSGGIFLAVKKHTWLVFVPVVLLVFVFNFSYFRPEKFLNVRQEDYLSGQTWDAQIKRSIFDYLPIFATMPPAELSTYDYEVISGEATVKNFQKGTNWIDLEIEAENFSTVQLSQYYFPGWKIYVNGKAVEIKYDNYLGLMTFPVDNGTSKVHAKLCNSPVRALGNALSLMGFMVLGFYLLKRDD